MQQLAKSVNVIAYLCSTNKLSFSHSINEEGIEGENKIVQSLSPMASVCREGNDRSVVLSKKCQRLVCIMSTVPVHFQGYVIASSAKRCGLWHKILTVLKK